MERDGAEQALLDEIPFSDDASVDEWFDTVETAIEMRHIDEDDGSAITADDFNGCTGFI